MLLGFRNFLFKRCNPFMTTRVTRTISSVPSFLGPLSLPPNIPQVTFLFPSFFFFFPFSPSSSLSQLCGPISVTVAFGFLEHDKTYAGGLLYKMSDSNMQYVTSTSFLLLTYAKYLTSAHMVVNCGGTTVTPKRLRSIAKKQVLEKWHLINITMCIFPSC